MKSTHWQRLLIRLCVIAAIGVFYLYAALAMLSLVCFIRRVPETRGRALEAYGTDRNIVTLTAIE